ncbi:DNA polymerase [Sporosarcina psychrophila]|uniref:DNA polymerase n=1 Tax=Sporosarcina psychrophila TaxID=1476 RepID=UPI00339B94C0
MIQRLDDEVQAQQSDEWFRGLFAQYDDTIIRHKLLEQGVVIPTVNSFTVWDTETSGTDMRIDMTGGYSFWLPLLNEGYYVAYGHLTDDAQCTRSKALDIAKAFLEDASHIKAFHNSPFDYSMILNDGLAPKGFRYCSMDASQIMNEHEESHGLKSLTAKYKRYIGAEHLDDFTFEDLFGNGSPLIYSPEIVGIYAIKDVEKGWLLTKFQIDMMRKTDNLDYPYFQLRQYLTEVNTTIERTGFVVNTDKLAELEIEFTAKLEDAKRQLHEDYAIDAKFLREMSRTLKGDKIRGWVTAQSARIDKQADMLAKCRTELKSANPTTKKYTQLKERIRKYESTTLPEAKPENAPDYIREFNLSSDHHLGYLIYDVLKVDDKSKVFDKKSERLTNKKVLALYYEREPALKPLAKYSALSTLLGTFVKKIPHAMDIDGRLHTNLKTVSTGRYSSKSYAGKSNSLFVDNITDDNFLDYIRAVIDAPKGTKKGTNLQNIPARTDDGKRVRKAFEPAPGFIFLGSDLSSIEPRIQAHRMATEFGDESFAEMFRKGLDPYTEFAAILFEVSTEVCTDAYYSSVEGTADAVPDYRKAMKQMFLAIGYGQAFDMFLQGVIPFGIGEEQARMAFDKFDEILPGFKGMVNATFEHLREHGWTASIFHQKRRFPGYVEKYKRLCTLMKRAGITDKNDPELGKKSNKLRKGGNGDAVNEFWDLMRFTGGCERAAFNQTIQSSGAQVLQFCMIRSYYELTLERGWEFNLTLHDEQKHSCPKDQLTPEVVELYTDIMTNTITLEVPLKSDTVIEPRWMEEYGADEWFRE